MTTLRGRARELAALRALVAGTAAGSGGGALVLHGDAGIGKTALIVQARAAAAARGMTVLATSGTEAEAPLAFAGLHHLLLPLLDGDGLGGRGASNGADTHSGPAQEPLRVAFGLERAAPPDLYRVALATLELLAETAARRPLLVAVDDAHWLDSPTADVLAFVARRLAAEPIAMLLAVRGERSAVLDGGLPLLELEALDATAAATLLDDHGAELTPAGRERILRAAAGNPLALVELPRSLGLADPEPLRIPDLLPLNARLERTFADRVDELPHQTRALLLLAATEPACDLPQLVQAARIATGAPSTRALLAPAAEGGLIELAGAGLRFRHPLIASGVYQSASLLDRLAAHAALAAVLADDPDRCAWHRAAATLGTDEEVVAALVAAADRAHRRGAVMVSVATLERAAGLTADLGRHDDLLLRAAEQASELGRRETATATIAKVRQTALGAVERGRLLAVREMVDPGELADTARTGQLTDAAVAVTGSDPDLAASLLWRAASRCWWGGAPEAQRRPVVAATARLALAADDARRLAILAYAAPLEHGSAVLAELARLDLPDDEPRLRFLGSAALILGDFAQASRLWAAAEAIHREQGRLALLARNLCAAGYARCWTGEWEAVLNGAREGGALAAETGEHFWVAAGQATLAQCHGLRGDHEAAERAAREALGNPLARGVRFVLFGAQQGLAYAAMAAGRHDEAYQLLRLCFDAGSPVFHRDMRFWVLGDLAELALRAGRADEARAVLAALAPAARRTTSPRTRLQLAYAEALLADARDAETRFHAAFALALDPWPLDRARIQLAYGAWLRRMRRASDSRAPLRAAQAGFAALGPTAWSARVREELSASGETRRARAPSGGDELTPQELQIATMAARGLTNRQIGQHLLLSPRTVGSHLYRIYPKLAIGSRGELAGALREGAARG